MKLIPFLLASALILTLGCYRKQPIVISSQFDSCITLGNEAVKIANEFMRQRDSLQAELRIYKEIVKHYLPKMTVTTFHPPSPRPIPDTTIKPRYEYYYKLMIPVNKFGPPLDTIDMVMQRMGKSMTVDQADELRAIVVRQLNNFIGRPVVDSVMIELPKK